MNAMQTLIEAGLTLNTEDTRLIVGPASLLSDSLRKLIRGHKPELWAAVREAEVLAVALVAAINRCCDEREDDDRNRAALIAECAQLTLQAQADMLEHFETEVAKLADLRQPQKKESS